MERIQYLDTLKPLLKYSSYGFEEIQNLVREQLPIFVEKALSFDCDAIIPIEDEGLSILIPTLKKWKSEHKIIPTIIPSRALLEDWTAPQNFKRVLVVDASSRRGDTLRNNISEIEKKYNPDIIKSASFMVLEDVTTEVEKLVLPYLSLTGNQYFWAKTEIVNYISSQVFYKWGDPPVWKFNVSEEDLNHIFKTITNKCGCYLFPNEDKHLIKRITIDNVSIKNIDWLPNGIDVQPFYKIRFFFDFENSAVSILPLFFPKIASENLGTLNQYLQKALPYFPKEINEFFTHSEQIRNTPRNRFRWLSAIGSILLLRDLLIHIDGFNNGLTPECLQLDDPMPNLLTYSCNAETLESLERLVKIIITPQFQNKQYTLPVPIFVFDEQTDPGIVTDFRIFHPYEQYKPEWAFLFHISTWINNLYKDFPKEKVKIMLDKGLSLEELQLEFPFMSRYALDRSLDSLIDEFILRARIEESKGFYQRTYGPAGETIRKRLRFLEEVKSR